jgi:shikimate dehydrogenase
MKKAFVIGHPIAHSRSPLIHGYWLKKYGIEGEYIRIDVAPHDLKNFITSIQEQNFVAGSNFVAGQNFVGGNVTIPHKEAVLPFCQHLTPRAQRLKAVNTIWFEKGEFWGDSTDGEGFIAHLSASVPLWKTTTQHVAIWGAGGAARGIIDALIAENVEHITILNRNQERAHQLISDLQQSQSSTFKTHLHAVELNETHTVLAKADLIINTTSLGMKGQPAFDITLEKVAPHAIVYDIVYTPLMTPLLKQAHDKGLTIVDGLGMLLHQAVSGFNHWFGIKPHVTPELRQLIVSDLEGAL